MRVSDHCFTEPTDDLLLGHDIVERWEAGADEREANRALCNAHFDAARDAALERMWASQELN